MTTTVEATISAMPRRPKVPGEVFVVVREANGKLRRWPAFHSDGAYSYGDGLRSVIEQLQHDLYWLTARGAVGNPDELRTATAVYDHLAKASQLLGGRDPAPIPTTKADGARALRDYVALALRPWRRDPKFAATTIALAFAGPFPEWVTLQGVFVRPHDQAKIERIVLRFIEVDLAESDRRAEAAFDEALADRRVAGMKMPTFGGYRPDRADAQQLILRILKETGVDRRTRRSLFDADARKLRGRGVKKRR